MPIVVQSLGDSLEVTVRVSAGGSGPFDANVTMSWNPAQLALKTVKQPTPDFSSSSGGVVQWFGNSIPGTGDRDFIVEFTCKAAGGHYVTGSGVNLSDGSAAAAPVALTCP